MSGSLFSLQLEAPPCVDSLDGVGILSEVGIWAGRQFGHKVHNLVTPMQAQAYKIHIEPRSHMYGITTNRGRCGSMENIIKSLVSIIMLTTWKLDYVLGGLTSAIYTYSSHKK